MIGAQLLEPDEEAFKTLENLFVQSKIRGLHATGVSYFQDGIIKTIKEAIPADQFIRTYNVRDMCTADGSLFLIGHCRYSTSDLQYNQPIADDTLSVVHNGVITQELPEHWEEKFGIKCETSNDTELLFQIMKEDSRYKSLISDCDVWKKFKDSSYAAIILEPFPEYYLGCNISFFRNGKRPIYHSYDCRPSEKYTHYGTPVQRPNSYIASTKDILMRSAPWLNIMEAEPFRVYGYWGAHDVFAYSIPSCFHSESGFWPKEILMEQPKDWQ